MSQQSHLKHQCPVHRIPVCEALAAQLDYICGEPGCNQPLTEVVPVAQVVPEGRNRDYDADVYARDIALLRESKSAPQSS